MCHSEVSNCSSTTTYLGKHQNETKNPIPNYYLHIFDFFLFTFF